MEEQIPQSNLEKYILKYISPLVGYKLKGCQYYDVCSQYDLLTNNNGIDIIAHQVELIFENHPPVFISWNNVQDWTQYSLCISESSFCVGDNIEKFSLNNLNWNNIINQQLTTFEVYGYKKLEFSLGFFIIDKYYYWNEPHLLVLKFENGAILGIANFYTNKNFIPDAPFGDDIWILFGWNNIEACIQKLKLDRIET